MLRNAALTPSRTDDPETVEEARANQQVLAKKTLRQVARGRRDRAGVVKRFA